MSCRSENSEQTASNGDSDDDGSDDGAMTAGAGKKVRWKDKQDGAGTSTSRVIHFSHSTPQSAQVGAVLVHMRVVCLVVEYTDYTYSFFPPA